MSSLTQLMLLTGTHHCIASAYYPQPNSLIEQTLQDIALPSVLFAIQTCIQKSTQQVESFFMALYRKPVLVLPIEMVNRESSLDYDVEVEEVVARHTKA